ncbi:MAG: hypothetical protein AAF420_08835 [Pseudomonadota bacterium]
MASSSWLPQHLSKQASVPALNDVVEGQWLTDHGYNTSSLTSTGHGSVFYVRMDHLQRPALMTLDEDQTSRVVADLNGGAIIDAHAARGVLIAQPEICDNYNIYYDLFHYTEAAGVERLTNCARFVEARWHPDGNFLAAVHVTAGQFALQVLDDRGQLLRELWRATNGEVIGGIDWAPSGDRIVAALWRPELGWNIEEFDISEGSWRPLTASPTIASSPHYDASGEYVYFSAEYGGVYNIWRIAIAGGAREQITDVRSGAFQPVTAADGSLYYLGNHPKGFDVYQLTAVASLDRSAPLDTAARMPAPETSLDTDAEVVDYSPLDTLRPRWWLPHLVLADGATEVGFVTSANDAINRHSYGLTLAADVDNGYPLGAFFYRYSPSSKVSYVIAGSSFNDVDYDDNDDLAIVRREDRLHLNAIVPFSGIARSWSLVAGVSTDHESTTEVAPGVRRLPAFRDNIASLGLTYNTTNQQPRAISRSDGRDVRMVVENSDVFDSDFSGDVYVLDWREFISLGDGDNVLGLRYVRGHGTDFPRFFELGGVSSGTIDTLLNGGGGEALLNRRVYELRGYDDTAPGLFGPRMQIVSAEWRFPIRVVERGLMTPPVGLSRVSGRLFAENGAAWIGSSPDETYSSAGFELHLDVNALFLADFRMRLGYAHGFDDEIGGDEIYLTIGGGF